MVYLDNAATSFPKPKCVINEVKRCLTQYCGNPGRSSHTMAVEAAARIYNTRELIADFLGIKNCENVVFTPNATYAINLTIKGLITHKCHCILSDIEHNSVLRPMYRCVKELGCEISHFDSDLTVEDAIAPLIRKDTEFIVTTLASNVTGKIIDLKELSDVAQKYNLKLIVDASQFLGHIPLSLENIDCTALCSAGHKALFGIQGSGFTVFNKIPPLPTLAEGGSGIDSFSREMPIMPPERYEPGTLSTPAIASLYAGIGFIRSVGIQRIEEHLEKLTQKLLEILHSEKHVKVYGGANGIVSFNVTGYSSSEVSEILNNYGIATRSGFHCAPLIHQKLGTDISGAVRMSFSYFNKISELDKVYRALRSFLP